MKMARRGEEDVILSEYKQIMIPKPESNGKNPIKIRS